MNTNRYIRSGSIVLLLITLFSGTSNAQQHSVARQWNEALLNAIRNDYARPTVHARNLWHSSILMYDAWAVYTPAADNFFLGDTLGEFYCPFLGISTPSNIQDAQEEAMSFAVYRLMKHRFKNSPGAVEINSYIDSLFNFLGYDSTITGVNYTTGPPAELGNFLAQEMILFGLQDSSNEQNDYANIYYQPTNGILAPVAKGNPQLTDPNRWQPLTLNVFIDQSGNVIPLSTPDFLSPEWGWVTPFALDTADRVILSRDGHQYPLFHNAPDPPRMDTVNGGQSSINYEWGFRMVAKWSAHLDTTDNVMIDISPASVGNVQWYPSSMDSLPYFYDENNGGDIGTGWSVNPVTGQAYVPQIVRRGDYARVLAEFWADGPDSETPPGHWFTILNYVSDHPQLVKKWKGQGPVLPDLEWDVKTYFTMGGTVHDAAVAAWALKGYHDYLRPISAIRWMSDMGQSSDSTLPSYHPQGIKLDPGFVELVDSLDPLADTNYANVGKIKLMAWAGPDSIADPKTDMAGVDWILAENWWPYQRPTFVTPPFAGFVSGHSTFSRAAADVMGFMTGDPYFPGGMGEFVALKNQFLVFEEGPSTDVTLQWATYRDASDQCSLSRIWGGIHPPADDMPGRHMGIKIGKNAFDLARTYWENGQADIIQLVVSDSVITDSMIAQHWTVSILYDERMDTTTVPVLSYPASSPLNTIAFDSIQSGWADVFNYIAIYTIRDSNEFVSGIDLQVDSAMDEIGGFQVSYSHAEILTIDTENPHPVSLVYAPRSVSDDQVGINGFEIVVQYNEDLDTGQVPAIYFPVEDPMQGDLSLNTDSTGWLSFSSYRFSYDVSDNDTNLHFIDLSLVGGRDIRANIGDSVNYSDQFSIDTRNPMTTAIIPSIDTVTYYDAGKDGFYIDIIYSEDMDTSAVPLLSFPVEDPSPVLSLSTSSHWVNSNSYRVYFDVDSTLLSLMDIDMSSSALKDTIGNVGTGGASADGFSILINTSFDVKEVGSLSPIVLYPNPVKQGGSTQLLLPFDLARATLEIFTSNGRLVKSFNASTAGRNIEISVEDLTPGTYFIHFQQDQLSFSLPLVIR